MMYGKTVVAAYNAVPIGKRRLPDIQAANGSAKKMLFAGIAMLIRIGGSMRCFKWQLWWDI